MRFEAKETIGAIDAPDPEDIRRGFLDDEWGDVGGNITTLRADDGTCLAAVSGDCYCGFRLSIGEPDGAWWRAAESFTVEETIDRFVRFCAGDREWLEQLTLERVPTAFLRQLAERLGL